MTSALLRRSRSFAAATGSEVTVLTFDDDRDYREISAGLLGDDPDAGVRILNLWCWLEGVAGRDGMRTRTRFAADGVTPLQVDHLRADGELLVTDRRDAEQRGTLGGRRVTLHDAAGEPLQTWKSIWGLYRYWLDELVGGDRAVLIADSKPAATFLTSYRRKRVLTAHVIHGSHLEDDGVTLRESRRPVLEAIDKLDLVVTLTNRQRLDLERLLDPQVPLVTIPNAIDLPAAFAADRDPERGIVLASLTERKRVGHALAAVAGVPAARLDIYGDGPERCRLESRAGAGIVFQGHVRGAARELENRSFLLVTSRSEGSPLAIMEALAAGCIPIAYDIPYGPADLIADGRTGFLVEDGDTGGLQSRIEELLAMPERRRARMRRAARAAAGQYTDAAVIAAWERAIAGAWARKSRIADAIRSGTQRRSPAERLRTREARGRELASNGR